MRWTISVEYTGEDGKKSTVVLGFIGRAADGTVPDNVGVNLQESKQILHRLQETFIGPPVLHVGTALRAAQWAGLRLRLSTRSAATPVTNSRSEPGAGAGSTGSASHSLKISTAACPCHLSR
jgi:hypothetical protein